MTPPTYTVPEIRWARGRGRSTHPEPFHCQIRPSVVILHTWLLLPTDTSRAPAPGIRVQPEPFQR